MPYAKPSTPAPSALGLENQGDAAIPLNLRGADNIVGDAASPQVLARLNAALAEMKQAKILPYLQKAVAAIEGHNPKKGAGLALKALEIDERSGFAWYLLAIAREGSGDFKSSLESYEAALALMPNQVEIANGLGRLAARLGMSEIAERLFRLFLAENPENLEANNNLACALRDQNRPDEAIEVLRAAIMRDPSQALLWNTLASVVCDRGDTEDSLTFFDEAVRLDPKGAKARYNRSLAYLALGRYDDALADSEDAVNGAIADYERAMMKLARSTMRIAKGDLERGWEEYEARRDPHYVDVIHYLVDLPECRVDDDLEGKSILVVAEQGLGDEVLFANLLPDLIEAMGPGGTLRVAVEKRLVNLFQRSFPHAKVGRHNTLSLEGRTLRGTAFAKEHDEIDLWIPMGSLLKRFRRKVEDFPRRERFLLADEARVAHWRKVLAEAAPPGPKVGILWKSLKINGSRARHFSPFERWRPILELPGVTFVNMQYGECAAELQQAREELGVEIWQPPGIDLKDDLDDVAALCCALDLVLGPANATTNIAAACGAPVWLIGTPGAWTMLGTDAYPWYPQVKVFQPPAFNAWDPVMRQIAGALASSFTP